MSIKDIICRNCSFLFYFKNQTSILKNSLNWALNFSIIVHQKNKKARAILKLHNLRRFGGHFGG